MFYNLSNSQIETIKNRFYPQEVVADEFFKTAIINNYGSDSADNTVRIIYSLQDGVDGIFKIFNVEQAKKYLKLKLFEISNEIMRNEISTVGEEQALNNIIIKYGSQYRDLTPSYDFVGSKTDINEHIKKDDGSIDLVYDVTLTLPRAKINFLSIGAVFYFDKQKYLSDQNVQEKFIDKRILFDKIYVYNLIENDQPARNTNLSVQDLRLVNSVFKQNNTFEEFLSFINANYTRDLISNIKKTSSAAGNKNKQKYLSNAYFSRNFNNSLGFVFNLNFYDLVKNNSTYLKILNKTELPETFIEKCKITSIKILRRDLQKRGKNSFVPRLDSQKVIINSADIKGQNIIPPTNTEEAFLEEIKLDFNINKLYKEKKFRTFSVADKQVFLQTIGHFQYGIEIEVLDAINDLLNNVADELQYDLPSLQEYLEETNKIVKINASGLYKFDLKGNYDPLKNQFTREFIDNFNKPRGNKASYQEVISKVASNFVHKILLLGLDRKIPNFNINISQTIVDMLSPQSTNAQTIQYFIKTYERFIIQIRNMVNNNYNNTFSFSYWFKNEYINTENPINIGYKYFDMSDDNRGLGIIDDKKYVERLEKEINKYSINPQGEAQKYYNKKYSYVSPESIYSTGKMMNLSEKTDTISTLDYVEMELDIKNKNFFGVNPKNNKIQSPQIKDLTIKTSPLMKKLKPVKQAKKNDFLSVVSKPLMSAFSVEIKNFFKQTNDSVLKDIGEQKDPYVNTTLLSLSLSRQFDIDKNTNSKIINDPINLENINSLNNLVDNFPYIPVHLDLLFTDNCKLLNNKEEYNRNIALNSKFQFLFNTLHSIEILEYYGNFYEETWSLLTTDILKKLKKDTYYVCRMKNYKDKAFNISGLEDAQIKMPIYNQYFLLFNTATNIKAIIQNDIKTSSLKEIGNNVKLKFKAKSNTTRTKE